MSAVRYVLARAAENGFFEAVVPSCAPFDPLLRGAIRKGARRAFATASATTKLTDEAHVLRLAFLQVAGRVASAPPNFCDDVEGVKAAFEASKTLEPKRGRTFWPLTYSLLAAIVASSLVGAFLLFFPSPRSRFAHSALGEAMGEGLTDWVVGVSRRDVDREDKGRNVIMATGVKRQIGDEAFNLLGAVLEQSKAASFATSPEDAARETEALTTTLRSLDHELQAKKLPGFFDVYVNDSALLFGDRSTVWLLGYYVEDRATMIVGSNTVPMLRGRRLDNLNLEVGGRAYESKVLDGWVLAIDEIEEWVSYQVVPALGKNHGFAFGAKSVQEGGSEGRLASKAGEKIRSDLLARSKLDEDEATELADLLVQRHTAFIRLAALGDELMEPRGIVAKPRLQKALKRRHDEMDAQEITRIEDRLSRFEKAFDRVVAAQAALDEIRIAVDSTCRKSKSCTFTADTDDLAKEVGAKTFTGANAGAIASRLAMIARAESTYLALAEAELGSGGYVTAFLVERELGLAPEWLSRYGVADEAEHAQLGVAAFDKPADAIKKAAESAYAKVFGEPMPTVSRVSRARP